MQVDIDTAVFRAQAALETAQLKLQGTSADNIIKMAKRQARALVVV